MYLLLNLTQKHAGPALFTTIHMAPLANEKKENEYTISTRDFPYLYPTRGKNP